MNLDDLLPKSRQAPKGVVFSYADGSANLYFITKELIQYAPMTPMRSSSGTYSGGEPAEVAISPKQFQAVKKVFEDAATTTANHIPNRVKMSGRISFKQDERSFNLRAKSNSQKTVEDILNKLLGK